VEDGFANVRLFGNEMVINKVCDDFEISHSVFSITPCKTDEEAMKQALSTVRNNESDILMKGLINTDLFLKSVLDKEFGLMKPKTVLSYVCAIELPDYPRLLFVTDPAVILQPDLAQKKAMVEYAVKMAQKFGIKKPKVALISATEKPGEGLPHTFDYSHLCTMARRSQIKDCIIDGPLDIFTACDPNAAAIKGIQTEVNGDADILLFPNIESCNAFYKGLMLFGKGELAGILQGTEKPVVMMSRSESELSKYYCLALACLMTENN
jgi:phosphate butyryltransferase